MTSTHSALRIPLLILALLGSIFSSQAVRAVEQETLTAVALRVEHQYAGDYRLDILLAHRWYEAFKSGESNIYQLSLSRNIDRWQFSGAYNLYFNRSVPGEEHRLSQQLRYTFDVGSGELESSLRVEERYFTSNQKAGGRLRILNSWSHRLGTDNKISLGHEWLFNMNDIGTGIRRGVSQNRLIGGLEHTLASGNRLEFQYQSRFLHIPAAPNKIQHLLQLTYTCLF